MGDYNKVAGSDKQVREGDYIVEVNGTRGDVLDIVKVLNEDPKLAMVVKRPLEIAVSIPKVGSSLGLDLSYKADAKSLLIKEIKAGPIDTWNANNPGKKVAKNDRIIAANSVSGEAEQIAEVLKQGNDILTLVVSRPSS